MIKKLGLLLAAVALMAFAVPTMAGAHAVTSKANTLAPTGTILTLTGEDVTSPSSVIGTTTCKKLTLLLTLKINDGTNVTGSGATNTPTSEGCVNGTHKVTVTEINITQLKAEGTETWVNFVWTEDIAASPTLECTFTGTKVPFKYAAGTDTIVFDKAPGISGSSGCGTATLTATFAVEIEKTPVILD
jgi:hypothetical protein